MTDENNIDNDKNREVSQGFSFRRAKNMIRKMHINSGDVILVKRGSILANDVDMGRLADALHYMGVTAIVAVVDDFDNLSVLNEIEMNKHGWIRTHTISRLIGKGSKNGKDL